MPLNLERIEQVLQRYMLDEVTITRKSDPVVEPITQALSHTIEEVYSGIAMVSPMGSPGRKMLGEEEYANLSYEIQIPLGDEVIQEYDLVTVTSSRDPEFLEEGTVLIVKGIMPGTFSVARRISAYRDRVATT